MEIARRKQLEEEEQVRIETLRYEAEMRSKSISIEEELRLT